MYVANSAEREMLPGSNRQSQTILLARFLSFDMCNLHNPMYNTLVMVVPYTLIFSWPKIFVDFTNPTFLFTLATAVSDNCCH